VSTAMVSSAAGSPQDTPPVRRGLRTFLRTPVGAVIAAATLLALGLRIYQITRPGVLLGVAWYDDGVYFASALRLVQGVIPYRDFVFAQPPGLTLLLTPAALAAKVFGTARGMAFARILTLLASTAAVVLGGLLVRHRGLLAVTVTCGLLAVFPASVGDARTIFIEPWVALFCLAGALVVFDGDRLAGGGRRLLAGGVVFGFAGAIESWAIIPVLVVVALALPRPRTAAIYAGGVAVGFLVPVVPFVILSPRGFYQSVFVAQLIRHGQIWVPYWFRLQQMTGLNYVVNPGHLILLLVSLALVGFVAAALAGAWVITRRPPPPLDWFAVVTAALIVIAFMWPPGFFFHFPGFLEPFVALAIALSASRLLDAVRSPAGRPQARRRWLPWAAAGLAGLVIVVFAVIQGHAESTLTPRVGSRNVAAVRRTIPPGACVLTDQASFTIAANRFYSDVPGCSQMIDPLAVDYALSSGRDALNGAGNFPAVAAVMRQAFVHAQYVWLSGVYNRRRIAWTPTLTAYFQHNFVLVLMDNKGDGLYVRRRLLRA
jgi:alpha-1,2-mannosyltransferase